MTINASLIEEKIKIMKNHSSRNMLITIMQKYMTETIDLSDG